MQREYAWRSLKDETTEHPARDNTRTRLMTRAKEIRGERIPLFDFLPSRVFSPRVFPPLACFITTRCCANCEHLRVQITTRHCMFCRLSFQWTSRTFTWHRKPQVFLMSFLQINARSFSSPENKHGGGMFISSSDDRTLEERFNATLVHIYHIFTIILMLKRCWYYKTLCVLAVVLLLLSWFRTIQQFIVSSSVLRPHSSTCFSYFTCIWQSKMFPVICSKLLLILTQSRRFLFFKKQSKLAKQTLRMLTLVHLQAVPCSTFCRSSIYVAVKTKTQAIYTKAL